MNTRDLKEFLSTVDLDAYPRLKIIAEDADRLTIDNIRLEGETCSLVIEVS